MIMKMMMIWTQEQEISRVLLIKNIWTTKFSKKTKVVNILIWDKNTERYYDGLFSDNDLVSISNSINCFSDNLFKVFVSILYANGLDKIFL